jgi:catechol-2,3-dioxygenase
LAAARALTGESSHGATKSLYGVDPDGNEFEIMWILPRESWGEHESQAVVERLDLDAELSRWAGVATA